MDRIYDFADYSTADDDIATVFFYLKKMSAEVNLSDNESKAELVNKMQSAVGYASRIKAALADFYQKRYKVDWSKLSEKSYGFKIRQDLNEISEIAFYFKDVALNLKTNELKDILNRVMVIVAGLPVMIAAVDAGQDEDK